MDFESLLILVFGCVLFSVVVQGLTIQPLLRRLGLTRRSEKQREFEEAVAQVAAAEAASDALEHLRKDHLLSKAVVNRLQQRFNTRLKRSEQLFRMVAKEPSLAEANVRLMQQEIGHAQKRALLRLLRRGIVSEEVHAKFTASIDESLRSSSTLDWILAADLKEAINPATSEDQAMEAQ